MRPSTVISLMVGAGALALAVAPAPEEDVRAGAITVAEAQLIEHIRELAQAPAEDDVPSWRDSRSDSGTAGANGAVAVAALAFSDGQTPPGQLPADAESSPTHPTASRVVLPEALNVRSGPSSQTSVIGRLVRGEQVTVLDEQNGWIRVSGASAEGWAFSRYLAEAN